MKKKTTKNDIKFALKSKNLQDLKINYQFDVKIGINACKQDKDIIVFS